MAIGCFSMSQCATRPARESRVGPILRLGMDSNKPAHLFLPYDHCSVTQQKIKKVANRGGDEVHSSAWRQRSFSPQVELYQNYDLRTTVDDFVT